MFIIDDDVELQDIARDRGYTRTDIHEQMSHFDIPTPFPAIPLPPEFRLKSHGPFGIPATTTFRVEELDEMREIKLRCQRSGFYSHWLLTDARGDTFAELEMGVEPLPGIEGKALAALHTKRFLRTAAERTLDGLRRVVGRRAEETPPS